MPVFKFQCPTHGKFARLVVGKPDKSQCPQCSVWSPRLEVVPSSAPKVKARLDELPETMNEEELSHRVARGAEEAWEHISERREKREEVSAKMSPAMAQDEQERREYREKLEQVMKDEPAEDLEAAGINLWVRDQHHEERLKQKYPGAEIQKTETK